MRNISKLCQIQRSLLTSEASKCDSWALLPFHRTFYRLLNNIWSKNRNIGSSRIVTGRWCWTGTWVTSPIQPCWRNPPMSCSTISMLRFINTIILMLTILMNITRHKEPGSMSMTMFWHFDKRLNNLKPLENQLFETISEKRGWDEVFLREESWHRAPSLVLTHRSSTRHWAQFHPRKSHWWWSKLCHIRK